jgi:hypothetical protein
MVAGPDGCTVTPDPKYATGMTPWSNVLVMYTPDVADAATWNISNGPPLDPLDNGEEFVKSWSHTLKSICVVWLFASMTFLISHLIPQTDAQGVRETCIAIADWSSVCLWILYEYGDTNAPPTEKTILRLGLHAYCECRHSILVLSSDTNWS